MLHKKIDKMVSCRAHGCTNNINWMYNNISYNNIITILQHIQNTGTFSG